MRLPAWMHLLQVVEALTQAETRRVSDPGPARGGGAAERRHRREQIAAVSGLAPVDRRPERDGPELTLA